MMSIEAMKQALEALESITWVNSFNDGDYLTCNFKSVETSITAIKEALAQPEQEPVAIVIEVNKVGAVALRMSADVTVGTRLYTTPPQRKPLTDEQIDEIGYKVYGMKSSTDRQYARAIEAAHGIKGEQ